MNSRERVLAAINHKPLDRFPLDIGGPISGISKIAYDRYLRKYASHLYPSTVCDKFQQLGCLHEEMLQQWKVDTRHVCASFDGRTIDENSYYDALGIKYETVYSPSYDQPLYSSMAERPLENTRKTENVEEFSWPKLEEIQFDELRTTTKKIRKNGYAVVADAPHGGVLELVTFLVGPEGFYRDLYSKYDFFETLIDSITYTFYIPYWEKVLGEVGEWIDIVLIGDDYGMQDRMTISPKMWRQLVKPRVKAVVDTIKNVADVKVLLHCCGSVYPIIPDLIEVGFDILNPIQPRAKDMNHEKIKIKFGDKLCFHGGVDIQEVMPNGTPKEVQQEVQRVFNTLGSDSTGYILATAHNILADVPPENIHAYLTWQREKLTGFQKEV
ncbi:MAG: uroporphyrinogen decarboxylase family protein [Promethearchaeota archaeon]